MTTPTQTQIEAAKFIETLQKAIAMLEPIAAAQVGERHPGDVWDEVINLRAETIELIRRLKTIEAATIERCAQVVEVYHAPGQGTLLMYLAAAIRKLKDDKPIDPNIVYPSKDLTNVFPEETE